MKKLKNLLQYNLLFIIIIFIVGIITILRINVIKEKSYYSKSDNFVKGYVLDYKFEEGKYTIILKAKEKLIINYYSENKLDISYGDYISVKGEFMLPKENTNFNIFSYKKYLLSQKIMYVVEASNITKISNNRKPLYMIKRKILRQIDKSKKSSNYIKTFIFADKSYIDKNIIESYQILGISHLFAISGMHVSLITLLLLNLLKNMKVKNKYIIISMFLLLYLFLTNFTISMVRACIQYILFFINKYFKLNIKNTNIVIGLFSILLLYNPYYIYNSGFIFSFSISFSLLLFSDFISNSNFIKSYIKVTVLSFFISLPIVVNNFNQINLLSIGYNLIFSLFVSYIIFPCCIISFMFPIFDIVNFKIISVFEKICLFFSSINIFKLNIANISFIIILFYYLLILLYIIKNKKKTLNYFVILLILLILNKSLLLTPKITIFDVGQGDSILIRILNKNIVVDTSGNIKNSYSNAKQILINYFKSEGVKKIDYLILTHGDFDHMGEAINLVNNFKVENVIFNSDSYNELENKLIKVLDKKKIKYHKGLKELNVGSDKLYFLNTKEYDNENDNSNVIYFKLNNYKFLFMGDAGVNREKDILDKYNLTDIDFIKVGHHGSNTSSSKEFIDEIKPKNCLISVGKNNRYGHPKENVLDILDDYCEIYRTDLNGSIEIKVSKNNYKIKTYNP